MDPLTALGLASNIVQLVDCASKALSKCVKIYKGQLVEHTEAQKVAQILQHLTQDVEKTFASSKLDPQHRRDQELISICQQTGSVAHELVTLLEKMRDKLKDKESLAEHLKIWKSVRQLFQGIWEDENIWNLEKRLDRLRQSLSINILVSLRESTITTSEQESKFRTFLETNTRKTEGLGEAVLRYIEVSKRSNDELAEELQEAIREGRRWRQELLMAIRKTHGSDEDHQYSERVHPCQLGINNPTEMQRFTSELCSNLAFKNMSDRMERIAEPHRKTFTWIFEDPEQWHGLWSNFPEWLRADSSLYWVAGKAGSGKSTLMKYVVEDERTKEHLSSWSAPRDLLMAGFFFWNSGASMQMSQEGLLQSLLYELLRQCHDSSNLVPLMFPDIWEAYNLFQEPPKVPPLIQLVRAMECLIKETASSRNVFLVMDGLDEFSGNSEHLLRLVQRLAAWPHVKICVSSRPWSVFEDAFQDVPKLLVQDLTRDDIQVFVSSNFEGHAGFKELLDEEPQYASDLVNSVVEKACGVFFWVSLVVRILLHGLSNGDRVSDLQIKVNSLPPDLEDMFQKIFDGLDPFYIAHTARLFQIVRAAQYPPTLLAMSFADETDYAFALEHPCKPMSKIQRNSRAKRMKRRLNTCCGGLLEATPRHKAGSSVGEEEVDKLIVEYLHRTVRDFIETPEIWNRIRADAAGSFNPNMSLATAHLLLMKTRAWSDQPLDALWYDVTWCIEHTHRAQSISKEVQGRLLDQLDLAATAAAQCNPDTSRLQCGHHWTTLRPGAPTSSTFLHLTVQCQLAWYLESRLGRDELGRQRLGVDQLNPLLRCALRDFTVFEDGDACNFSDPSPTVVDTLLRSGADPNYEWQMLLDRAGADPSISSVKSRALLLRIVQIFIAYGANTNLPRSRNSIMNTPWWEDVMKSQKRNTPKIANESMSKIAKRWRVSIRNR